MGHSAKFQAEILVGNLETQAEKMLEQVLILRESGLAGISDQLVVQHERLLGVIAMLRGLNI